MIVILPDNFGILSNIWTRFYHFSFKWPWGFIDDEHDNPNESVCSVTDLPESVNEIEGVHEEMKQKMPNIDASSDDNALHNKQRRYPVNPADSFFKKQKSRIYSISTKRWKPRNCCCSNQVFS